METQSDLFNTRVIGLPGKREENLYLLLTVEKFTADEAEKKYEIFFFEDLKSVHLILE